MADLADIQHLFGDDIAVGPTGDFALVTTESRTQLRIIRRLLTSITRLGSSAYPWEPTYGAGLGEKVGETLDLRVIKAIVMSQMLLEPSVAKIPLPQITVARTVTQGGVQINIRYTTLVGVQENFTFHLTNP